MPGSRWRPSRRERRHRHRHRHQHRRRHPPRPDPRPRLQRPRRLRPRARAAVRPVVGVPGPRVRGPVTWRLRGAADRRRLVHRRARRGRRRARALQHVPPSRHAGVPRRARQRVALPLPVPRLVVPQRRAPRRPAVPPGRLRRRRRAAPRRPPPPAGATRRHDRRDDLRQPRTRRPVARASHLGDFAFYLGFYTRQSPSGLEVRGPQRWRVRANWKIGCENFVGDMYHTPHTHRSVVDIGLFREPKANKRKEGVLYFAGAGGGTTYKLPPGGFSERMRYVGYPDEMIARAATSWTPEQVAMVADDGFMVSAATLFPNLSFVHNWPQVDDAGTVVPFISIRQWQPVSSHGDRGAVVVRRRSRGAGVVQARLVPGVPHVLRQLRHVRAGRCRELGVDHEGVGGHDGPAPAPQQPDGADVRRTPRSTSRCPASPARAPPASGTASSTSATG